MESKWLAGLAAAAVAAVICLPAQAQSPEAELTAYAVKAAISGLPTGPYSKWTEAQRQSIFGRVRGFCQFLCVDKYANATFKDRGTVERTAAAAKVCLDACIASHLPADYPKIAEITQELRKDYDKAKQLGAVIPWPLPRK
jgi:hypothetical protein